MSGISIRDTLEYFPQITKAKVINKWRIYQAKIFLDSDKNHFKNTA